MEVFGRAWFRIFRAYIDEECKYPKNLSFRMNEVPYFIALLNEECFNEYTGELEKQYLNEFRNLTRNLRNVLSVGCGYGKDLRLVERNKLGIDIFPCKYSASGFPRYTSYTY